VRNSPEQLLISSVLRNGDLKDAMSHGVNRRMFHIYTNEWAWIEDFYLKRSRTPSKAAFLAKFPNFRLKVVDDTPHFTDEVREEHKVRSVLGAVSEVLDSANSGDGDTALNKMFSQAMKISSDLGLHNDGDIFRDHEDILKEFAIRKERFETMGSSGIPTGFETFDERTGGFAPGESWVWAARLGQGKSFNLQKMGVHAALCGYNVLYYALEQPRANVMARIIPLVSPKIGAKMFTSQSLIRGKDYDQSEFLEFMHELRKKVKGNFHVADGTRGRIGTTQVASGIEMHKPDIVFIDHITLMDKKSQDHLGVAEVADELDYMSKQYNIPVVQAAQLNRNGSQKGAGPETLAESDKIGQNASGIVFLEKPSKRVVKYYVQKARNTEGNFGWWARFSPDKGVFDEIDYDTAQELMELDAQEEQDQK
jgi:replicative DNA helicase